MEKSSKHDELEADDSQEFTGAPMVVSPRDGLPEPVPLAPPPPVPMRHPDNFVCLRGPCAYYWRLVTMAGEGNPEGTFANDDGTPRYMKQVHHTCLRNPGYETSFEDDNAYECNQWDPIPPSTLLNRDKRRAAYWDEHPEHDPRLGPPDDPEETDA